MEGINDYIDSLEGELISLRRDIHQYPELGFKEYRTSKKVFDYLRDLGLEVEMICETGVVALLDCGEGPTVALRADMDALPIGEETDFDYKSKVEGVMHACGHDGHTAILLMAAKVLSNFKDLIKGKVKFIFQPAEEGPGGAKPLIEAGLLDNPKVDQIFGLHIEEGIETGIIGLHPKEVSASADEIDLIVKGKGGHASAPHRGVDAIVVASQIVTSLQTIVSRKVSPHDSVVISLGQIKGGHKRNIIADKVEIAGTVRTTDPDTRRAIPEMVEEVVKGITLAHGADYSLEYNFGYPVLINDESLVEEVREYMINNPLISKIKDLPIPSMGAEDFSYYLNEVPGIFFRLGAAEVGRYYYPGHHPKFYFDERALKIGVSLFISLVLGGLD